MQNQNDNQDTRNTDPVWYFLAEYTLSKDRIEEDLGGKQPAGLLFQATQDLGIPQAFLKRIERSLIEFAKGAMAHFDQDKPVSLVVIHLFCLKKKKEVGNLEGTLSQYQAEPTAKLSQINRYPDTKANGGWGFFLIEREEDDTPGSSEISRNQIDLYLYKEGE